MKKVLIAVQARTGSHRLPGKSSMAFGDGSLVGNVMLQAKKCADWLTHSDNIDVMPCLLVPFNDNLAKQFEGRYVIYEGPEDDVLTRYHGAMLEYGPDYIVRITGDCVWITSFVIAKLIRAAIKHETDYCSNILIRTFMEGLDVEVLSSKLLEKLYLETEEEGGHREHVTSIIPSFIELGILANFRIHTVFNEYDLSHIKTSIDTLDEYDECTLKFQKLRRKKNLALELGGISN